MVTNQIMKRPMGNFTVEQRTKDSMFNATSLLKQWNDANGQQKQIVHYTENAATKEFIKALIEEENIKERNSVLLQVRGKNGGTWMHPLLFIDFAMWLNPTFKVKVLKFVSDQMLKYRNDAGDAYRELGNAMSKICSKKFMPAAMCNVAKAINYTVFGEHQHEMRNKQGEEGKQYELFNMERQIAMLINDGFLHSYDQVIEYLRKKYTEKYLPSVLQNKK